MRLPRMASRLPNAARGARPAFSLADLPPAGFSRRSGGRAQWFGQERRVPEVDLELHPGSRVKLGRGWAHEPDALRYSLTIWLPTQRTRWLPFFDSFPGAGGTSRDQGEVVMQRERGVEQQCPMLVGIRHTMKMSKRTLRRSWASVVRLETLDKTEPMPNPFKRTPGLANRPHRPSELGPWGYMGN
jgi:hypothetical protein